MTFGKPETLMLSFAAGRQGVSTGKWMGLISWTCLFIAVATTSCEAQYKGDHIPGILGLSSGTQAPPGLYLGNVVWVYPTSTVKDDNGNSISLPGSLTSTVDVIQRGVEL
jgi:hypothetical protein